MCQSLDSEGPQGNLSFSFQSKQISESASGRPPSVHFSMIGTPAKKQAGQMSHLEPLNTPRPLPASGYDIVCQSPDRSRYLRAHRTKPTETFKQKQSTTHAPTAFTLKAFTLNLRWNILHTFKAQRQYDFIQSGTMHALFHVPHAPHPSTTQMAAANGQNTNGIRDIVLLLL